MELIRGIGPFNERIACDHALLGVELTGLAQEVLNPLPCWTLSLSITEYERQLVGDRGYHREAIRRCVATFMLHRNVSLYFWPRFSFGDVYQFRVIQEPRPRGQTALKVRLDMLGKGRLYCRDMELLGLQEIGIETQLGHY